MQQPNGFQIEDIHFRTQDRNSCSRARFCQKGPLIEVSPLLLALEYFYLVFEIGFSVQIK